jgi:sulfur-carrier protein
MYFVGCNVGSERWGMDMHELKIKALMKFQLLVFGQLAEELGVENLEISAIADTDSLVVFLEKNYPGIVGRKYIIAVDKKLINTKTALTNNCTVALMPAYSGG